MAIENVYGDNKTILTFQDSQRIVYDVSSDGLVAVQNSGSQQLYLIVQHGGEVHRH